MKKISRLSGFLKVLSERSKALLSFAILLTLWNILGHTWFGFEQPWIFPFVGVGSAMLTQLVMDLVAAKAIGRDIGWWSGRGDNNERWAKRLDLMTVTVIPGLACAMLLYPNENPWPIALAAALSICSKALIHVRIGQAFRHVFNPSNFGIAFVLTFLPSVGLAPPYHFTQNLPDVLQIALPLAVFALGIAIHVRWAKRLWVALSWLGGFVAQGVFRSIFLHDFQPPLPAVLMPMGGTAFVVFTLFMIPDPATTPEARWKQLCFGFSVAAAYGVIQENRIVFGLFYSLVTVCALRGMFITAGNAWSYLKLRMHILRPVVQASAARTGDEPSA